MDWRHKTVAVFFLLCSLTDIRAMGQTPDVCSSCHANATCDDKSDGSGKVCNCMYGFVGNGRTFCQDKDECQIGANKICGHHTSCHNTYGSYYCTCLSGYSPSNSMSSFIPNDGTHCQDIDECQVSGLCGEGGRCMNLDGSFECHCEVGYQVHNGAQPFHPQRDKASCKVIDCGQPPSAEDMMLMSATGTRYGSVAVFDCDDGLLWRSGNNTCVCGADGAWKGPTMVCEAKCGPIPFLANSEVVWHDRSVVIHRCVDGYHSWRGSNVSICDNTGVWQKATLTCIEVVWQNRSVVIHRCVDGYHSWRGSNISICDTGIWQKATLTCMAKCGPIPFLANSEVVWQNKSVVIHCCVDGYHSWRGSNISICDNTGVWQKATLTCIEIKPAITDLVVFNEKCLWWKAEKYEDDTEVYKVIYMGSRAYQRLFHDKRKRFLNSKADRLQLCLNLLPATNYSISITAVSAKFTVTVTTNTSLKAPQAPVIYYREVETPLPTLRLLRPTDTLDQISLYQVFVLPVEAVMVFDCTSPGNSDFSSKQKSLEQYVTAQIQVRRVGREMNFTVGDGLYYGGFYNAPLQNGRDYYIILRAVSQWNGDFKSACVLWAKAKGTSYVIRISSLSAGGSVGLVTLVILGGYSYSWFSKM
ncbi:sushi domain-containing protein 1 isoform X2 [Lampris incognitus]|uniref:sushi domain-containing protein 1 isoform X2 n=1 Tax=Lampris incognitus TaxID=2546036 RepID=UPI0024B49281|nr:sushi domain-containing protein 1 isoform X2 [Lampris incognitus]